MFGLLTIIRNMKNYLHGILQLMYFAYLLTCSHGIQDEYFPKRFFSHENQTIFIYNDSMNMFEQIHKQSVAQKRNCPVDCFIHKMKHDMVDCYAKRLINPLNFMLNQTIISCEHSIEKGELIIGHKESIRGMMPGSLNHLLILDSLLLTRTGQLSINLNMNMLRLDVNLFDDLKDLVSEVKILNTVYIHPDSLFKLQHLRSFEIESGQVPLILVNEKDENADEYLEKPIKENIAVEDSTSTTDIPTYLRLQIIDPTLPISFNLNTECHQCAEDTKDNKNTSFVNADYERVDKPKTFVIVFINKRDSNVKAHFPKLNMIFPYTCPLVYGGIGCPDNVYTSSKSNPHHNSLINTSPSDLENTSISGSSANSHYSLSVLLSIWCTIITLVFIFLIFIFCFCVVKRSKTTSTSTLVLLKYLCLKSPDLSKNEDLGSNSMISNYSNQMERSITLDKNGEIGSPNQLLLNCCENSWNDSLRLQTNGTTRSTSLNSIKDPYRVHASHRQRYSYASMNRRTRLIRSNLRSVGSQTDFNDLTYASSNQTLMDYSMLNHYDSKNYFTNNGRARLNTSQQFINDLKSPDRNDRLGLQKGYLLQNDDDPEGISPTYTRAPTDLLTKFIVDENTLKRPRNKALPPLHPHHTNLNNIYKGNMNKTKNLKLSDDLSHLPLDEQLIDHNQVTAA